jgi:outer membrane protein OmpA-like peptidoglycan-associated protein
MHRKTSVGSLIALFLVASVGAFGADKVKGMITSRAGETLIVSNQNEKVTVLLNDDTKTKDNTGLFGLDKDYMSAAVLIPGLKVEVEGMSDAQGRIVAKMITVDGDDLETAEMIQAGLHPTAEQVLANEKSIAANKKNVESNQQNIARNAQNIQTNQRGIEANQQQIQENIKDIDANTTRFMALSEYDVKDQATVKFEVGSSKISAAHQEELQRLAQSAVTRTGYIVEILGYADVTGTAAMNQKLSEDRAKAVVAYLIQQCNVPVRHIVAPGAMGIYQPAASNETKEGRAENRRVEIKVLTNKGIAGS